MSKDSHYIILYSFKVYAPSNVAFAIFQVSEIFFYLHLIDSAPLILPYCCTLESVGFNRVPFRGDP